jgi:hypothetical protein
MALDRPLASHHHAPSERPLRLPVLVLMFFSAAIFISWPLALHMQGFVLPAQYKDISHSDTEQHIGKIQEAKQRLSSGRNPIIVDSTDVSQPYVFLGIVATRLGASGAVWHNLYFLLSITLCGVFMHMCMRELTGHEPAALFAGVIYSTTVYLPFAYYWGHSNTMTIQYIPVIFWLTERVIARQKISDGAWLGAAMALQFVSSSYTTVFMSCLLPLYVLMRLGLSGRLGLIVDRKTIVAIATAGAVGVALSAPYLWLRLTTPSRIRTLEENSRNYWRLDSWRKILTADGHLTLGTLQTVLFAAGLFLVIKNTEDRAKYLPFVILFFFVVACMVGPVSPFLPYYWLFAFWPFFDRIRVPFRMEPFALMALSVVASIWIVRLEGKPYLPWLVLIAIALLALQLRTGPWTSHLHMAFR